MADKKSFVMYMSWEPLFTMASKEQAGELIQAIYNYQASGEEPDEKSAIYILFQMIKKTMDEDADKYAKVCESRKESAKKGGQAKAAKSKQKVANTAKTKQSLHESESESDSDNESESDNDKDIPPKSPHRGKTQVGMVDESDLSDPVKVTVKEWLAYKHERRFVYKETGLQVLLRTIREKELQYGQTWVIKAIENSISNGWQGISWDAMEKSRGQPRGNGAIDWANA